MDWRKIIMDALTIAIVTGTFSMVGLIVSEFLLARKTKEQIDCDRGDDLEL